MKLNKKAVVVSVFSLVAISLIIFWKYQPKSGVETVPEAVELMKEFMGEDELRTIATTYTYGGVFPASEFMPNDKKNFNEGIMMWYCLNLREKKFFMAIERAEISKLPTAPGAEQVISDKLTKYDNSEIERFLQNDKGKTNTRATQRADETLARMRGFTDFIVKHFNNSLKQMPYAFFQNNQDEKHPEDERGLLQQLCEQPNTKYIRYYFGCDFGQPSNKIRILLFSVDEHGNNILEVPDGDKGGKTMKPALVLQRSVPPGR
jgi:hypothetical protein